jgi:hypothetical protein
VDRGTAACLTVGSLRVDGAVVAQVLDAIQPAGIDAALTAMHEALHDDETQRQAIELALEKARYEARRAQRQFDAVDPENRLVASELEQRWNHALAQVAEVEARLDALHERPEPLSVLQKERLLELGTNLRLLWHHADAPVELKKRILRTVLEDIIVTPSDDPPQQLLHLHWKGGVHTELRVARNGTGQHRRVADDKAVELITELSKICDDKGDRTLPGSGAWTSASLLRERRMFRKACRCRVVSLRSPRGVITTGCTNQSRTARWSTPGAHLLRVSFVASQHLRRFRVLARSASGGDL